MKRTATDQVAPKEWPIVLALLHILWQQKRISENARPGGAQNAIIYGANRDDGDILGRPTECLDYALCNSLSEMPHDEFLYFIPNGVLPLQQQRRGRVHTSLSLSFAQKSKPIVLFNLLVGKLLVVWPVV